MGNLPVNKLGIPQDGWYCELFEPLQLVELIEEKFGPMRIALIKSAKHWKNYVPLLMKTETIFCFSEE